MVKINNVDYTARTLAPIKWGKRADGSLEIGNLTIANTNVKEVFKPLTIIEIDGKNWLIYYDTVEMTTIGKTKRYSHTISFIEQSKAGERFVVDTCTFTNSLYANGINSKTAPQNFSSRDFEYDFSFMETLSANPYVSPIREDISGNLTISSFNSMITDDYSQSLPGDTRVKIGVWVERNGVQIASATDLDQSLSITKRAGSYVIGYSLTLKRGLLGTEITGSVRYNISIIPAEEEKKTITDVVNRVLLINETLRESETPYFSFNSEQAEAYSKVNAPEFTFTKKTLREVMAEIGSYIHKKPVLNGTEWSFVDFISTDKAVLPNSYIAYQASQDIENYCSEIDSYVQNMMNIDDEQDGTIVDPYYGGWKTPRTETGTVRIDESSVKFKLKFNAEKIIKLELGYLTGDVLVGDITPWLYEQTEYQALSSYEDTYPDSKALAIYYKKGTNEITGLTFEPPHPIHSIFTQKAIVNIINDKLGTGYTDGDIDLTRLQFRATYIPKVNARVKQVKDSLKALDNKATMIYNATSNEVDSDYYGEHLKEVVARLGNAEEKITYVVKNYSDIPEIGQMIEDNKWISSIDIEKYKDFYKFTVGISKDIAKRNEYLGIDSSFRLSEVSIDQVYDRWVVYEDMCIVGNFSSDEEALQYQAPLTTSRMLRAVKQNFIDVGSSNWVEYPCATYMRVECYNKDGFKLAPTITLPCSKFVLGNNATFMIDFDDNFGAADTITGRDGSIAYQEQAKYVDILGNTYSFDIAGSHDTNTNIQTQTTAITKGDQFPYVSGYDTTKDLFSTDGDRVVIDKDNREAIHFAYTIHCVSKDDGIIIGSGLPKKFGLHERDYGTRESCDLYVLDREITKLEKDMTDAVYGLTPISYSADIYDVDGRYGMYFYGATANRAGKSFVFVDHDTKELVFGKNVEIAILDSLIIPNLEFRRYKKEAR